MPCGCLEKLGLSLVLGAAPILLAGVLYTLQDVLINYTVLERCGSSSAGLSAAVMVGPESDMSFRRHLI